MQSWLVGSAFDCDIVINHPEVSARHCRLLASDDGQRFVDDLNSTNGTFVNGKPVTSRVVVTPHDHISLVRDIIVPWPIAVPKRTISLITIGRDQGNDLVLDYPMVSTRHALLRRTADGDALEDLKSSNGTYLETRNNRVSVAKVKSSDHIYFGSLKVHAVRLLATLAKQPATSLPSLSFTNKSQIVLGRDPQCDHVVDHPMVSWHHARVFRTGINLVVEDLGSSNGTFINGTRIDRPTTIKAGDVVGLGSHSFVVKSTGSLQQKPSQGNVSIQAYGVCIDVPGKRLVHEVSFTILPAEFVGLMGASGAGKSTLLNAINGYSQPTRGRVLVNGHDFYEHYDQYRGHFGYVPQDDIIHADLTVSEALYFSARLRLPTDFSDSEIHRRITVVLKQLGLSGTENVLIGSPEKKGISGGQRKRVNLGIELLTDPSVLILDEPTSGLSSEDALLVMKLLRELADGGKTVLLTIHQPSLEAFQLLDNLLVLGKDQQSSGPGEMVYYGPAFPDSIQFFEKDEGRTNGNVQRTPDQVLRGLAAGRTVEWTNKYKRSTYQTAFVDQRSSKPSGNPRPSLAPKAKRANGFTPWWALVRRSFATKVRDRWNTAVLLIQAPVIGILIGLVFGHKSRLEATPGNWESLTGGVATTVFLSVLAAIWFGCSNAAREIVGEWAIYRRERMVNLGLGAYIASKFAVLSCFCMVQCAILLGIVYWTNGLHGNWFQLYFILVLAAIVGVAIGLFVSSLARSSEMAIACLPLAILPMVILGGILQPLDEMTRLSSMAAHLMPSRWAFEAALLVEADARPRLPLPPTSATQSKVPANAGSASDQPQSVDLAELFFAADAERMGIRAATVALAGMVGLLALMMGVVLLSRDIR